MSRVHFEEDRLVVEPFFSLIFKRKIKIKYDDIEKIEFPGGTDVLFYLKNGKVKKVPDPGICTFYTGFGEMLKKYRIPYREMLIDTGHESIETVRDAAEKCREMILAYTNLRLHEKYGPEYEFEAKIVERIVGTTVEIRFYKNGVYQEDADLDDSIDGESLVYEFDVAYLCGWDPEFERGEYFICEEAVSKAACEQDLDECMLKEFFENYYDEEA